MYVIMLCYISIRVKIKSIYNSTCCGLIYSSCLFQFLKILILEKRQKIVSLQSLRAHVEEIFIFQLLSSKFIIEM